MATIPDRPSSATEPQPAWDVALLFPSQGDWSEFEYLALDTNRLVELVDGNLEVLPMPTILHQLMVEFLFDLLRDFVSSRGLGKVFFAPLPIHIRTKTFREPDVFLIGGDGVDPTTDRYLTAANLVMEVVSPDNESHKRDYDFKQADYAALGIPEYWIVDPQVERITVLTLDGKNYRVHGEFAAGQQATSVLLEGFAVDVSAAFAAGKKIS
jgi:Uma2 family endonuclease